MSNIYNLKPGCECPKCAPVTKRSGEEIIADFQNRIVAEGRRYRRRLFWLDITLCVLTIVIILSAVLLTKLWGVH